MIGTLSHLGGNSAHDNKDNLVTPSRRLDDTLAGRARYVYLGLRSAHAVILAGRLNSHGLSMNPMIKLKYLRHPIRTATSARSMVAARLHMRRFAFHGKRHFANDSRYDLDSVTNGFAPHPDDGAHETTLQKRITSAYVKAVEQEQSAPEAYKATPWWESVRRSSLQPVMQALRSCDTNALRKMYRNLYRDPCSAGLMAVPYGMSNAFFRPQISDVHRHFYLSDTLYRLDYWKERTGGLLPLSDLTGPTVGNPFGAIIDGILIRSGAEYQHYCAYKIAQLLKSDLGTVQELGGGFGAMAYYLLRNRAGLTYIDFDVPESIALASYFLMKSFPHLRFLLYGEEALTTHALERADVILMPLSSLEQMPAKAAHLAFSSHAMADLGKTAMAKYLAHISRTTRDTFLYIGSARSYAGLTDCLRQVSGSFQLLELGPSGWNAHKTKGVDEIECSYGITHDASSDPNIISKTGDRAASALQRAG
jgi:hypothetical protein